MKNLRRTKLQLAASSIALGAMFFALPNAMAQSDDQRSVVDVLTDTITVTATKKADGEDLQTTPAAITAYGAEALDALFVQDIQGLSYSMPNVQLEDIGTIPGTANFSIRGVAVNSSIPSIDPAVALVYDDIPLAINTGVIFDTFDLGGVEVLRGPQGTLFGRNATAGAVVLRTSDPTDVFSFKAKAGIESGLLYRTTAVVSGPLSETFSAKLGVLYENDEGYFENEAPVLDTLNGTFGTAALKRDDLGDRETWVIRPALTWKPSDVFDATAKIEIGNVDGTGNPGQNRGLNGDEFETSINGFGSFESEWNQYTLKMNWDVLGGTITNITGYRDYESTSEGDIDSSPLTVFHSYANTQHEQFSNELRYNGRVGENVDLTVGVFHMDQDLSYIEDREIPSAPIPFLGGGVQDVSTLGLFAQADIDLTDRLTLTVGGRYTDEEKEGKIARIFAPNACTRDGCTAFDVELKSEFDEFTPKVGAQYQWTPNTLVYASYTEGVRAGGFNFRNTSPVAPFTPFGPEKVKSTEAGIKTEFGDGMGRLNAAVFNMDLSDLQREVNRSDPTAGVVQEIRNTADATIQGIEAELLLAPTDSLVLTAMLGMTTGDYDEVRFDISGDGIISENDLRLDIPRLAPRTYGVGFVYDTPIGQGNVTMRGNYNHRAEVAYSDNNLGRLPAFDAVDASIAYSPKNDSWKFSIYGKNLLDEISFGNDTQLPATFPGGSASAVPGNGATFSPLNKGRIVGFEIQYTY